MARRDDISAEVTLAEAAAWLVRLQRGDRTPATDAAFKEWMRNPQHAHAFSRATETWEIIPGAARLGGTLSGAITGSAGKPLRRGQSVAILLAASLALLIFGAGVTAFLTRDPVYATKVGQQETITLRDGTRVALNTDSKVVVEFSNAERRVRLDRGEAMFEVAKNRRWPFVVQAGDEQVRALGTTFTVRKDGEKVAVVLVEGHVEVTRRTADGARRVKIAVMDPGERLTLRPDAGPALDRPKVETAIAWRQGEVMFDDSSLGDAVAEVNRYGGTPVQIADPAIASLRTSGVFQTDDPQEFAQAVAELYHLRIERLGDRIVLSR